MSNEANTVIVGCKLPNGLHLDVKDNSGDVRRITIVGANASTIVGGYGMTPNVPADFMALWFKKNAKHPAVLNHSIFIHSQEDGARAIAKEQQEIETGLQPIDPIKQNMLNNDDGDIDKKAVANYEKLKAENPRRNAQRQE